MRLLCYQWQEGSLPKDDVILARLAQTDRETIAAVLNKFREGTDGRLRNPRMEKVRKSLNSYRKQQSQNGSKGGRPLKPNKSDGFSVGKPSKSSPTPTPIPSPTPQTPHEWMEKIRGAYPRKDSMPECRAAIAAAMESGEQTPEEIFAQVQECAGWINKIEAGGTVNGFITSARNFFGRRKWTEPREFEGLHLRIKEEKSKPRPGAPVPAERSCV